MCNYLRPINYSYTQCQVGNKHKILVDFKHRWLYLQTAHILLYCALSCTLVGCCFVGWYLSMFHHGSKRLLLPFNENVRIQHQGLNGVYNHQLCFFSCNTYWALFYLLHLGTQWCPARRRARHCAIYSSLPLFTFQCSLLEISFYRNHPNIVDKLGLSKNNLRQIEGNFFLAIENQMILKYTTCPYIIERWLGVVGINEKVGRKDK